MKKIALILILGWLLHTSNMDNETITEACLETDLLLLEKRHTKQPLREIYAEFVKHPDMAVNMRLAYESPSGIHLGKIRNQKAIFVAGTRNPIDWLLNIVDAITPPHIQCISGQTAKHLEQLVDLYKPKFVFAHSRGSVPASKLKAKEGTRVIAMDGAVVISHQPLRVENIYQDQWFDGFLNMRGGCKNVKIAFNSSKDKFHRIYA